MVPWQLRPTVASEIPSLGLVRRHPALLPIADHDLERYYLGTGHRRVRPRPWKSICPLAESAPRVPIKPRAMWTRCALRPGTDRLVLKVAYRRRIPLVRFLNKEYSAVDEGCTNRAPTARFRSGFRSGMAFSQQAFGSPTADDCADWGSRISVLTSSHGSSRVHWTSRTPSSEHFDTWNASRRMTRDSEYNVARESMTTNATQ